MVLADWISYEKKTKKYFTKFPPPPYDAKTKKNLKKLLQTFSSPLNSWPEYETKFQGHAKTFTEACLRMNELETNEFAYSGNEHSKKIKATKKVIREKKVVVNPEKAKQILQVTDITEQIRNFSDTVSPGTSRSVENKIDPKLSNRSTQVKTMLPETSKTTANKIDQKLSNRPTQFETINYTSSKSLMEPTQQTDSDDALNSDDENESLRDGEKSLTGEDFQKNPENFYNSENPCLSEDEKSEKKSTKKI
ncbi:uncharacterized protein LOC127286900 isoform X2 [Leptopilina boulardi]|uniref:uncharacterized protein LOC127286900 isoform X2 n=1 Tax=Leptopilina boulardi TaxID=63433 RepID=UPI0021F62A7B|nr:uncharacterized protein LOC127286900 isoform X2 [Leptopilina boulardi]